MILALIAAAAADCTLIVDATVHTPEGPRVGWDLRIEGERITQLAEALEPGDCELIQGAGKQLTPGLIDVMSNLGLVEVGMESATHDQNTGGPSVRVIDGYNPRSSLIPVARMGGVTAVLLSPGGGSIAGPAERVDLIGATQQEALAQGERLFFTASVGSGAAQGLGQLRLVLEEVRRLPRGSLTSTQRAALGELSMPVSDLQALRPLAEGKASLVLRADRASDIEAALRFADEQGIDLVLSGGAEAWMLADQLAAAQVPVIVDATLYGPRSFDTLQARPDNARALHEAGVTVIFSTTSAHNGRELTQFAGNAAREGLDHQAALAAITASPAEVFDFQGQGRLEVGAQASLVLWSGDPLELLSSVDALWVRGRRAELRSRQTELRDRYLHGSGGTPAPLSSE